MQLYKRCKEIGEDGEDAGCDEEEEDEEDEYKDEEKETAGIEGGLIFIIVKK